jgi:probable phosphoglycerate mutase
MPRILLARHGETSWNAAGRLQGHTDIPLNDAGRAQARALAAQLRGHGIARVFTSDLARARETGEIVAAELGLPAPIVEPELRERRFGIFEGLTRDEIIARYPESWSHWRQAIAAPEGGEPHADSVERITRALHRVWAELADTALVVSHGGVMRLWLSELAGEQLPGIGNGATFVVEHDGTVFRARPL